MRSNGRVLGDATQGHPAAELECLAVGAGTKLLQLGDVTDPDQDRRLELAALHVRKQVGATRNVHGIAAGGRPTSHGLARGAR